jgi:hypothetical protein
MKRSLYCAVLLTAIASATMAATPDPPETPFEYFVSLYKQPHNTANADGGWTEKVYVYMGNNAAPNNAPVGPGYNIQFKVLDPAGHNICSEVWHELSGIPTGRTYAPYTFQIVYPKPPVVYLPKRGGKVVARPDVAVQIQYKISIIVYAEHSDKDQNPSNNAATQSFLFTGGGTPSCTRLPRDEQLQH